MPFGEFIAAFAGAVIGSTIVRIAARGPADPEAPSLPVAIPSGPKVFRRASKKATPKVNDDFQAWKVENGRES